jgi:excisionase family DNA binding protein
MTRTDIFTNFTPVGKQRLQQGADNFAPFSSDRLLTAEEASAYLHIQPRTLSKLITGGRANKLKASFVGRRWLVTESSLREFIQDSQTDVSQNK